MKHHTANQLNIEVAHPDDTPTGLAHHGEGFGKEIIEGGFFSGGNLVSIGKPFKRFGNPGFERSGLFF